MTNETTNEQEVLLLRRKLDLLLRTGIGKSCAIIIQHDYRAHSRT